MAYPSYGEWRAALPATKRKQVDALVEQLKLLGCPKPELWARSEVAENIPQRARFLVLRKLWENCINPYLDNAAEWTARIVKRAEKNPKGPFGSAAEAVKRMLGAGATPEDLGHLARMVAYEAVSGTLYAIDEGHDPSAPEDAPSWALMESDAEGELTGRVIGGLHESILSLAPSGHQGDGHQ